MKTTFWFFDINYEVRDHKSEVWIWGIDDKDRRILIIDRNFTAYFYLVIREGQNPQTVVDNINSRKAEEFASVIKLEQAKRRYFGKPVDVVKVLCQDPEVITKYAKAMAKIEGVKESLEDDIRYSMRYLIDNAVSPCGWHEIEVEEAENTLDVQVDRLYIAKLAPKNVEKTEMPKLRVLGFSTIAYSQK